MKRIFVCTLAVISLCAICLPLQTLAIGKEVKTGRNAKVAPPPKDTIHVVGHAHMDMNWLWTYSETMKMCNDNLRQTVAFMDEFPDFTMLQSQAAVYNFVEMVDPPLLEMVKKYAHLSPGHLLSYAENLTSESTAQTRHNSQPKVKQKTA